MSKLWPEGNDATLIKLVSDYLQGLSQNSSVDEETRDSLGVAVDCLSSIIQSNNATISNNSGLSLVSMYEKFGNTNNSNSSSNSTDKSNSSESDSKENKSEESLSPQELQKRLQKFSQFVKVLNTKNFFKNTKKGSPEYEQLLDTARKQWNQRFPQFELNSLDLILKSSESNASNDTPAAAAAASASSGVDKEKAAQAKGEGNKALQKKDFKTAIAKYSEAINLDPANAIYYSNRSAAYCYIKDYNKAAIDARKATEIDATYVKAWVRLGVSEFELENYEAAQNAYNEALKLTPATDKNWELYMERVQLCEQKLDSGNVDSAMNENGGNNNNNNQMPDMSQLGNLLGGLGGGGGMPGMGGGGGGGQPNFGDMLQNMGGMEGLQNLMQNPMMQQMASNLMKDPSMMQNLQNMMGNQDAQNAMNNLFGGGGGANSDGNDDSAQMKDAMQKLLQDPEKSQEVMKKAMEDDEVKELMGDPTVAPLITRIRDGDYTALMEASQKPELMVVVKKLMKKYLNE